MEVGDYVRVKNTEKNYIEITKIKKFYLDEFEDYRDNDYWVNEIIKSSPNIIDLIEVGDYVDGEKVDSKDEENVYVLGDFGYYAISKKSIKSVLTKEQFENCMYKIGE